MAICMIFSIIFMLGLMIYVGSKGREEVILCGIIMICVGVIGMVSPCCCFLGSYFMTHYRRAKRELGQQSSPYQHHVIEIQPQQQDITDNEPIDV